MDHQVFEVLMTSKAIQNFRAQNPTVIGRVAGYVFYEHPRHGDEAPLYATDNNGTWGRSHFWEVPGAEEILDF